jgi:excisionase family DNA binding protein
MNLQAERDTIDAPVLLTVGQVATVFRCTRHNVYRMLQRRELGSVRVGAQLRIPAIELDAYIARRTTSAVDPERETLA